MPTNTGRYIPNKGKGGGGGGGRWDKGGAKGGDGDKVNKVILVYFLFYYLRTNILKRSDLHVKKSLTFCQKGLNFMSKRSKLDVKKV